ncbi:MAG TPA: glycosyltransferase family 2 protein [Candidatus Eisenbacteria bacterium]|nr:glycosyltransferase family 2 protein [Candidatus Eisenbacteria bacterium]
MTTVWLVLPAYNEERSLPALLERCVPVAADLGKRGAALRVVVVDDGSKDGTIAAAKSFEGRLGIEVVPHVVNRGLGAALRTGLAAGLERAAPDDAIATMDADNTHDPALLGRMLERLQQGADVVIASRYEPGGEEIGLSPIRRVLSRGASFLLTMILPVRGARDYTCGYRLYRVQTLRRAAQAWGDKLVEEAGFTCMAEVLLKLGRGGAVVAEVPLVLRYDLKVGASKMKVGRTIARYFALSSRLRRGPLPRVV